MTAVRLTDPLRMSDYEDYVRDEWRLLTGDSARLRASQAAVAGIRVARVLDVGCGGGQELIPFVAEPGVVGIGVDRAPQVGLTRGLWTGLTAPGSKVVFVRARAELLPFADASFDVVVCRLALPYTHNATALSEIARVLRRGGVLLLKYHHARYYARQVVDGLAARRWERLRHGVVVLSRGTLHHLTGWQSRGAKEIFQTEARLRRQLAARGLAIERRMPDWNPFTPSYVVARRPGPP